jgi:subtilisin family serine protease
MDNEMSHSQTAPIPVTELGSDRGDRGGHAAGERPLDLVGLSTLIAEGRSGATIAVGVIDGPVDLAHPALAGVSARAVREDRVGACRDLESQACSHGTGILGILAGERSAGLPGICRSSDFLLYPIFGEPSRERGGSASATPGELARAILETVDAGARIINLSLGMVPTDTTPYRELEKACDHAARSGVILVVAAGNQGHLGFLPLLNHP